MLLAARPLCRREGFDQVSANDLLPITGKSEKDGWIGAPEIAVQVQHIAVAEWCSRAGKWWDEVRLLLLRWGAV